MDAENQPDKPTLGPETIMALHEIYLKVRYFKLRGEFYEQEDGLVMGSPVSAVAANIYMLAREERERVLASCRGRKPKSLVEVCA